MNIQKTTLLALSITTAISLAQPVSAEVDFSAIPEAITFNSQLVDAAEYGNMAMVQALILSGTNPNEVGDFGTTALIRATYHGSYDIVKYLLDKGARPNIADVGGATPLQIAAREGHDEITKLLIKSGANVNSKDNEGNTALMKAALKGNAETQKIIIAMGADVNKTNEQGDTALIYAANTKKPEVVKQLVASGADVKSVDQEGSSVADIVIRAAEPKAIAEVAKTQGYEFADLGRFIEENELDKLAPASGGEVVVAQEGPSWMDKIASILKIDGEMQVAAVSNFKQGNNYVVIDLGGFKNREFAEKRVAELKDKHGDLFGNIGIGVVQQNGSYNVNAGVLENKTEGQALCKKLAESGTACRLVETSALSQQNFNIISGKEKLPETAAKTPDFEDKITPVPVAKVEAKADPISAPKLDAKSAIPSKQNLPLVVSAPPESIAAKASVVPIDLAEPASKTVVKTEQKPIKVTRVEPKPSASATDTLAKIFNKEESKPMLMASSAVNNNLAPQEERHSEKVSDKIEIPKAPKKPVVEKEEEKSLFELAGMKDEPAPAPKVEPVVSDKDRKIMEKLVEKVGGEPAPVPKNVGGFNIFGDSAEKEPEEEILVEQPKAPEPEIEIPKKVAIKPENLVLKAPPVVVKPAPTKQPVVVAQPELPVPAAAPLVTAKKNIISPILTSKREPEPVVEAKVEEPKPQPKKIELPKELEKRIEKPPVIAVAKPEEPKPLAYIPPKPIEPIQVEQKIKELPQLEPLQPVQKPNSPKVVFGDDQQVEQVKLEDKFRVATPVKVAEPTQPTRVEFRAPANVSAPSIPTKPVVTARPNIEPQVAVGRTYTVANGTHYARVDGFRNQEAVQEFWSEYGRHAPQASANPLKSVATDNFAAVVGPFSTREDMNGFCKQVREGNFPCSGNKILSDRPNYRQVAGNGISLTHTRHSDLYSYNALALDEMEPASGGSWLIQLGSYNSAQDALEKWNGLQAANVVLRNREPMITGAESRRSNSSKFRLRVGSFESRGLAEQVCQDLRHNMVSCILVRDN